MCLTRPVTFWKKQKNEYKKVYCYINQSQNQAGLFFEVLSLCLNAAIHPFDSFLVEGLLEFGFWNAIQESLDCFHRVVQTELTTPQRFLENWKQTDIAGGQIRTTRGCRITSICLLVSQASTVLVMCGRALSWCKIHRCFNNSHFIRIYRCNCCNTPQ